MTSIFKSTYTALAVCLVAACSDSHITEIEAIHAKPMDYLGKTVTVSGTASYAVGVGGYGTYTVTDNTGSITVITNKGVPKSDSKLDEVTGAIAQPIAFGNQSMLLMLQGDVSIDSILKLLDSDERGRITKDST